MQKEKKRRKSHFPFPIPFVHPLLSIVLLEFDISACHAPSESFLSFIHSLTNSRNLSKKYKVEFSPFFSLPLSCLPSTTPSVSRSKKKNYKSSQVMRKIWAQQIKESAFRVESRNFDVFFFTPQSILIEWVKKKLQSREKKIVYDESKWPQRGGWE